MTDPAEVARGIAEMACAYTSDAETPYWREAIIKAVLPLVQERDELRVALREYTKLENAKNPDIARTALAEEDR